MKFVSRPRPTGEAARAVWKLYDLPLNRVAGIGTEYAVNDGTDWAMGTTSKLGQLPHDQLGDSLRRAHHAGRVHRLVGGQHHEGPDDVLHGQLRQVPGAVDVVLYEPGTPGGAPERSRE